MSEKTDTNEMAKGRFFTIARTSDNVIMKKQENDNILFARIWYPTRKMTSYIATYVTFNQAKKTIEMVRSIFGLKHDDIQRLAYVELNDDEFQHLFSTAEKIQAKDDFDALVKEIEKTEQNIDNEITEKFSQIVKDLIILGTHAKLRKILGNKKQVRQILELYAYIKMIEQKSDGI